MHLHLPVTGTPQCPCKVRTGHSKTDCFIIKGEREMIWHYRVCVSPLQVARPLRFTEFRTRTNTLPVNDTGVSIVKDQTL